MATMFCSSGHARRSTRATLEAHVPTSANEVQWTAEPPTGTSPRHGCLENAANCLLYTSPSPRDAHES
eukprot:1528943-Prymnesium_polylepis.2